MTLSAANLPTVSVVIPVYNGEKFVARAINSVLAQTVPVLEVIVVNDGSKDGTSEVLAGFAAPVRVISIPNGGVANARNTGIRAARGEWVAFLDADDIWFPEKIAHQLAGLKACPDVAFSFCSFKQRVPAPGQAIDHLADRFKARLGLNFDAPLTRQPLAVLIEANIVGTCSNVILRRTLLDKVGLFNANYRQAEDYDLWLRCAMATPFLVQSACLLEKVTHGDNLTNDFGETLLFHEQALTRFAREQAKEPAVQALAPNIKKALAAVRFDIGNELFNAGRKREAFAYFWKAFAHAPCPQTFCRWVWESGKKLVRLLTHDRISRRSRVSAP
jgi:glycosyltransferase involved in cell wall biosynthesis